MWLGYEWVLDIGGASVKLQVKGIVWFLSETLAQYCQSFSAPSRK